jgi:hypothetical protein
VLLPPGIHAQREQDDVSQKWRPSRKDDVDGEVGVVAAEVLRMDRVGDRRVGDHGGGRRKEVGSAVRGSREPRTGNLPHHTESRFCEDPEDRDVTTERESYA